MLKLLKRIKPFLILLIFSSLFCLNAQTVEEVQQIAEQEFKMGHLNKARALYLRVLYFTPNENTQTRLNCINKIAICYEQKGQYEEALKYYSIAEKSTFNRIEEDKLRFKQVELFILMNNFSEAAITLMSIQTKMLSAENKQLHAFYSGIIFYGLNNYESSIKYFSALIDSNQYAALHQLKLKALKNGKTPSIIPRLSSVIIPGSGQLMLGEFKQGINSLLLNAGFVYLFGRTSLVYTTQEALLTVFPWFFRYYSGGIKNVKTLQIERKRRKKDEIYKAILELISLNS